MIYFLQGTEDYLFKKELEKISDQANVARDEIIYFSAHETEFSTLVLEMNTLDLFGTKKVIVLKDLAQYKMNQYVGEKDRQQWSLLHKSKNILVIQFLRDEPLSKMLQEDLGNILDQAKIINVKKQKEKAVMLFIEQALSERKHALSANEMQELAQKYQYDLALIDSEIKKVKLGKAEADVISFADFHMEQQYLEEQVFDLIQALEMQAVAKTFTLLDNILIHQQNVFGLFALLLKNYKEMYQISALTNAGYSLEQVQTRLALHPYRAKILFANAKQYSEVQYQFILNKLIEADINVKTGGKQRIVLEELFVHLLALRHAE